MHLFKRKVCESEESQGSQQWQSKLTVKGHFNEVTDLDWDKQRKQCLVSCSSDQTTRILTKCLLDPKAKDSA